LDQEAGKYRVKYGSGFFDAYSYTNEIYVPKTPVHILVPGNDFNKKKTIIGRASTSVLNTNSQSSSTIKDNNFNYIGNNILFPVGDNQNSFSLNFKLGNQEIVLYKKNGANNLLDVNEKDLKVYLEETEGLYFSADFKAIYSVEQLQTGNETYYLSFDIVLRNGINKFATMIER
jgi:hypothetical protein